MAESLALDHSTCVLSDDSGRIALTLSSAFLYEVTLVLVNDYVRENEAETEGKSKSSREKGALKSIAELATLHNLDMYVSKRPTKAPTTTSTSSSGSGKLGQRAVTNITAALQKHFNPAASSVTDKLSITELLGSMSHSPLALLLSGDETKPKNRTVLRLEDAVRLVCGQMKVAEVVNTKAEPDYVKVSLATPAQPLPLPALPSHEVRSRRRRIERAPTTFTTASAPTLTLDPSTCTLSDASLQLPLTPASALVYEIGQVLASNPNKIASCDTAKDVQSDETPSNEPKRSFIALNQLIKVQNLDLHVKSSQKPLPARDSFRNVVVVLLNYFNLDRKTCDGRTLLNHMADCPLPFRLRGDAPAPAPAPAAGRVELTLAEIVSLVLGETSVADVDRTRSHVECVEMKVVRQSEAEGGSA